MGWFSKKITIDYDLKREVDNVRANFVKWQLSSPSQDLVQIDYCSLLLGLVAADGVIAKEEVQFINEYLGLSHSVNSITNLLQTKSEMFVDFIPFSVRKIVSMCKMASGDEFKDFRHALLDTILLSFGATAIHLCSAILFIDKSVTTDEIASLVEAVSRTSEYIEKELGFVPDSIQAIRNIIDDFAKKMNK